MRNAYRIIKNIPASVLYANFALLLLLATAPAWQPLLFGLSLDDLLSLRCFDLG